MTRIINALAYETYDDLLSQLPNAVKTEEINEELGSVKIELSDAVIMKVYDNSLSLDLGGKKMTIEAFEFETIEIR